MGGQYKVTCKCAYETWVMIGAGRVLCREGRYIYPVLCQACNKIGDSVFGGTDPICSHCQSTTVVRYDDPTLRRVVQRDLSENSNTDPESKRHVELTEGLYFCPVCKDFALSFKETGDVWC